MSDVAIRIENVSKMYRLGQVGTGTLSHDMKRWWYKAKGKGDPYQIVGEENRRDTTGGDYVWALKDISFDVKKGEVFGIVGKNGAGKSTLLKLLSRVTAPTKGNIKARGRIASLLEVGTGFHPELSGRENIFLNGAVLGMTKSEIKKKFDEIVDFAGVARYIETPVKRYSSGMYVRLAFAVAAHLDPEILIVDEVLAVGDAEFQKKCLGRMKDVSVNEGRTVLFVSHNMGAINSLCDECLWINNGQVKDIGKTGDIVNGYLSSGVDMTGKIDNENKQVKFNKFEVYGSEALPTDTFYFWEPITMKIGIENVSYQGGVLVEVVMFGMDNSPILFAASSDVRGQKVVFAPGENNLKVTVNQNLMPGAYYIEVSIWSYNGKDRINKVTSEKINVLSHSKDSMRSYPWQKIVGVANATADWTFDDNIRVEQF